MQCVIACKCLSLAKRSANLCFKQAWPCHYMAWLCLHWKWDSHNMFKADTAKTNSGLAVPPAFSAQIMQTRPSQIRAWPCHIEFKAACKADTAKPKSGLAMPHSAKGMHGQAKLELGRATWWVPYAKFFSKVLCNRDIAQFKCGGGIEIRFKLLSDFYLLVVFLSNSFSLGFVISCCH